MPSKYRNRVVIRDGVTYHSEKEFNRWCELQLLARAGIISDLRRQVPYELKVNGMLVCKYVADATYRAQDGKFVCEDVKGVRTKEYVIKSKLMLAIHGIRVLEV